MTPRTPVLVAATVLASALAIWGALRTPATTTPATAPPPAAVVPSPPVPPLSAPEPDSVPEPPPAARRLALQQRTPGHAVSNLLAQKLAAPRLPGPSANDDAPDTDTDTDTEFSVWPATSEGVRHAMAESLTPLASCYKGWLAVDPNIAGRIQIAFTVAERPDEPGVGGATNVHLVSTTTDSAPFEACVASVMRDLAFDVPAADLQVTYPLLFSMVDEP